MSIDPADRLQQLPAYVFADIARRITVLKSQGHQVIRLDMGVPDLPPPPAVIQTLATSAQNPSKHGYTGYRGTPEFRKAVARYYGQRFGVEIDPDTQVLPLMGSKEGLLNLCLTYLNPGDLALVPGLGYPVYARGVMLSGAEIHWLPLREECGFLPQLDAVPAEVADRAKLMFINYPNNPTGAMASMADYRRISAFCQAHHILLVSDNPYFELTFDGREAGSLLQVDPGAVEFISFSKTYNMSGWRLGAAVGNRAVIDNLLSMRSNGDSGHFAPIYDAGIAALERTPPEWSKLRNQVYQRRRDMALEALPSIGLQAPAPPGAMYVWASVTEGDGQSYTKAALEVAHVSLTPGEAFGPDGTEYVRFSLGIADDELAQALERLKAWYTQEKPR